MGKADPGVGVEEGRMVELEVLHSAAAVPPNIAWGTEPGLSLGVQSWGCGSRQAMEVGVVVCAVLTGAGLCSPTSVPGSASHSAWYFLLPRSAPPPLAAGTGTGLVSSPPCVAPHCLAPGFPSCPPTGASLEEVQPGV